MSEFLATKELGNGRSIHIASLSRRTILDSGAEHLGFDGYFLFETTDTENQKGINVLGKAASFEAGLAMADLIGS